MSYKTYSDNKKKEMGEIGIKTSQEIGEKFNRHLSSFEDDIASNGHIDKDLLSDAAMNLAVDVGVSAAKGGIDFLGNLFGYLRHKGKSFSFESFLENTGKYFDSLIQNVCSRENARYIGGKLIVDWNDEDDIDMTADFYFLSPEKEWITQKCTGSIDVKYISDWETNCDLMQLRGSKRIEFPITLPK